ncbi:hypothetical protein GCK72_008215 [Caenorhabditis remanei]|uniref:Uncharacterized protein n=1 Tax=Caenorhabditis remanei TaxID=31234 RepID=A0A6A5GWW8_CAERE|nr:hypothetical protein GCK72_008215 [Caenorhabditis remanei]KAF1759970.1 hypothetical protein GCK72_008215 [Caenorhabditis remanei]
MKTTVLLMLLPLLATAEMRWSLRIEGNLAYDGSEKIAQQFLDSFHRAVRSGVREVIAAQFVDQIFFMSCEKVGNGESIGDYKHYNRSTLVDYLVNYGSNVTMELVNCAQGSKFDHKALPTISASMIVRGIGEPFLVPAMLLIVDGKPLYWGSEVSYCKFGRPSETVGDGSMSVVYDFLESFGNAMKNRQKTENFGRAKIAEHFSEKWVINNCTSNFYKEDTVFALSTLIPTNYIRFILSLYESQYVNSEKRSIAFKAQFVNLPPFDRKPWIYTIEKDMKDGKFKLARTNYYCSN